MRPRSNSLPTPKPNKAISMAELTGSGDKEREKVKLKPAYSTKNTRTSPQASPQFFSYSACSSPTVERRATSRQGSEKGGRKKLTMSDLRAFVETKLLSKSDKMVDKAGASEKGGGGSGDSQVGQNLCCDLIPIRLQCQYPAGWSYCDSQLLHTFLT